MYMCSHVVLARSVSFFDSLVEHRFALSHITFTIWRIRVNLYVCRVDYAVKTMEVGAFSSRMKVTHHEPRPR